MLDHSVELHEAHGRHPLDQGGTAGGVGIRSGVRDQSQGGGSIRSGFQNPSQRGWHRVEMRDRGIARRLPDDPRVELRQEHVRRPPWVRGSRCSRQDEKSGRKCRCVPIPQPSSEAHRHGRRQQAAMGVHRTLRSAGRSQVKRIRGGIVGRQAAGSASEVPRSPAPGRTRRDSRLVDRRGRARARFRRRESRRASSPPSGPAPARR